MHDGFVLATDFRERLRASGVKVDRAAAVEE